MTASLASGSGPLDGTTATFSAGVASFLDLAENTAGTLTLIFKTSSLSSVASGAIIVSPAGAYQLVIQTQPSTSATAGQAFGIQPVVETQPPSSATAGQAFGTQPVIEEEDQYGNLETGDDTTVVQASLESGAGPLEGTMMATVAGGLARFTNLAVDRAETIALGFSSGSLAGATADPQTVAPAAAVRLVVTSQPAAQQRAPDLSWRSPWKTSLATW